MTSKNTYHPGVLSGEKAGQSGFKVPLETGIVARYNDDETRYTGPGLPDDVFGPEDGHDIKYKTLSWPLVAVLMITEIVSNGMLSLPSSLAAVGVVPGVVTIFVLGAFATYTSWVLIQFKLRHPEVHNMGDAGLILFGPIGREILGGGTVIFAVCGTGSQILAGQLALSVLSDERLCAIAFSGIFAVAVTLTSFPRTLDHLGWISIAGGASIIIAGLVGMAGAGALPIDPGDIAIAVSTDFTSAFISITNPVFAYAGHFMFFVLISEMKRPQDAMKAAWTLQIVATTFYIVFAVVTYWYIGRDVASPSFLSLSPVWSKITFGLAIPNFFIAGSLYSHTAAKLVFVRIFRHSRHMHSHTFLGWGTWTFLILLANVAAFVLAVGIPIFNYIVGIAASLFAAWYTYGLAGAFWLHDAYHFEGGARAWFEKPFLFAINVLTILAGGFICVGGLYATIKSLQMAAESGELQTPFQC
ncbi:transmembrane amino acid transporter protein-domain-containing protein [Biscogniauxia marginata]|nr:transmembrane amino acid transporter protein-domain-containing protein [Biscogniauxia marginata]